MTYDPLCTPEDRRKGRIIIAVIIAVAVLFAALPAFSATIKSKSGASANVASSAQGKFQALVTWLDAHNYPIKFMGGIRPGKCWSGGMHPCGKAIDINQVARGRIVALSIRHRSIRPLHRSRSRLRLVQSGSRAFPGRRA
jgi:hypothetical protein